MSDPSEPTAGASRTSRRAFLTRASAAVVAGALVERDWSTLGSRVAQASGRPTREPDWDRIADLYGAPAQPINLDGGFFGTMARPVLEAHLRHVERVNREGAVFARREYPALELAARTQVARFVGVQPSELVFARNATEALQALISQYRHVGAGDTVMYADLDYPAMQQAMDALATARGATVARFDFPEPATHQGILEAYDAALRAHPRTRLLLVTHCNNKTGLLHPVRDIVALAKARGVDVICDAAHSFGQVPLSVADLGADFVGLNLHKWVGAPVGIAAMVIREARLDAIARAHGDPTPETRIEGRLHTGTTNFAVTMTVPDALDFQASIGLAEKSARLRALRDRWVHAVREVDGVEVLTPDDPTMVCALTSVRLRSADPRVAAATLVRTLYDEFGVFTVARSGIARGDAVRITPTLANRMADVDALAAALRTIARRA